MTNDDEVRGELPPDLAADTPPPVAGAPTSGKALRPDVETDVPPQSSTENDARRAAIRRQGGGQ